jgi:serine/threonine-protein phosphatase 2A regulatory subunit A
VPNVKFNVAKMLEKIVPLVDPAVVDQTIRPCLTELSEDGDSDVRFYAKQAMYACDSMQAS